MHVVVKMQLRASNAITAPVQNSIICDLLPGEVETQIGQVTVLCLPVCTEIAITHEYVMNTHLLYLVLQWNLLIRDTLVHRPLSLIRRLSLIGRFGIKLSFYELLQHQ